MELNWELCRIFYQVARCRNFSRAAAMLFTSQPAVSRSMAALERELGCRLFIRNRRGVELTPEGRMFYAHVEAGCEQFRRGREELEQAVGLQSGSIALGASETALRHWLLPRLDRFHALYPGVRLRLFGGTSRQAIDELKSGAIDFAVAAVPEDERPEKWRKPFADSVGDEVYHTMQGMSEFVVTGKLSHWSVVDKLGDICIPTLVTSGTADECTPLIAKQIADGIPGAEWALLEGTHMVHLERLEEYNATIEEFMERHE